jgi:uncharacterized damage-inducible protein DinB
MSPKLEIRLEKKYMSEIFIKFVMVIIMISSIPARGQETNTLNHFKIDFFKVFNSSSGKLLELAEVIPAEDYDWRPTENVRSIKESLMHVAGTHFYLASKLEYPIPEDIDPGEFEKSSYTKSEIQKILIKSIEHIRSAIENIKDKQLYDIVNFFGGKETKQRVILQVGEHMAEHLGQMIVYARMQNVTPPWSRN